MTRGPSRFWLGFSLGWVVTAVACSCVAAAERPLLREEPPRNAYLADSPWPMSHRNPYNQASTPMPGPTKAEQAGVEFLSGEPVAVTLAISAPYASGDRVVWGNTLQHVFKLDSNRGNWKYYSRLPRTQSRQNGLSGAYSIIDKDNTFFVPRGPRIEAYRDQSSGDIASPIVLARAFDIPAEQRQGSDERIVGMNMTYDGCVAFVTNRGLVGVVTRDFSQFQALRLHGGRQEVSNSLAVDEEGGLYVVTSKSMNRLQWDHQPGVLSTTWSAPYQSENVRHVGRVGRGSGTTPTLMGVGDQDKFVVICDGQRLMRLVLYWRNEIPSDWPGLPGRDRRVAAEMPVRFGWEDARFTTTEQSLVVRGCGVAVVSNRYGSFRPIAQRYIQRRLGQDLHSATIYKSNEARIAPYGIEKLVWNPETRELQSVWANRRISCPNGVPAMSSATGLIYCIGQRNSEWTLEALDWETGKSEFHRRLSAAPRYNSFYAATQVGADGAIISGAYGGVLKFAAPASR